MRARSALTGPLPRRRSFFLYTVTREKKNAARVTRGICLIDSTFSPPCARFVQSMNFSFYIHIIRLARRFISYKAYTETPRHDTFSAYFAFPRLFSTDRCSANVERRERGTCFFAVETRASSSLKYRMTSAFRSKWTILRDYMKK